MPRIHRPQESATGRIFRIVAVLIAVTMTVAGCSTRTTHHAADTGDTSGSPTVSAPALPARGQSPATAVSVPGLSSGSPGTSHSGATDAPSTTVTTPSLPPPTITSTLDTDDAPNPTTPITVQVTGGMLTAVELTNPAEGITVDGAMSADTTAWTSSQVLGYGKNYRLQAEAVNADGTVASIDKTFSTLQPGNMTMPYFETIGRYPLRDGGTYGVGIVAVVHFDEPIPDKAAAEKALTVTTTPAVTGSWYWSDAQNVRWRPKKFYPAGTKVTIDADVYGVDVGDGLYGQADRSISFTIGRTQITHATDSAPATVNKVVVTDGSGTVLRTMNTSMGKHSGTTVNGKHISFYTMSGTYTVLDHENPAMMSSESYGLPADAPGGYKPEPIYWATRISTDGIFLHQLNTTVWAQNSGVDTSHGCLNLNKSNAEWFFKHSLVGDPVIVDGAKGAPTIGLWQGGDWSVPWSTWTAGSALK